MTTQTPLSGTAYFEDRGGNLDPRIVVTDGSRGTVELSEAELDALYDALKSRRERRVLELLGGAA